MLSNGAVAMRLLRDFFLRFLMKSSTRWMLSRKVRVFISVFNHCLICKLLTDCSTVSERPKQTTQKVSCVYVVTVSWSVASIWYPDVEWLSPAIRWMIVSCYRLFANWRFSFHQHSIEDKRLPCFRTNVLGPNQFPCHVEIHHSFAKWMKLKKNSFRLRIWMWSLYAATF